MEQGTNTSGTVVIHIGRHKCASTTLQDHFFPQLTKRFYKHTKMLVNIKKRGSLFPSGPPFDLGADESNPIILSREGFSLKKTRYMARKLYDCFPNARIICIVREQRDLLSTVYVWRFTNDFLLQSLRRFLGSVRGGKWRNLIFNHVVLEDYERLFGKDNILVLPYELLCRDAEEFYRAITDFSNINTDYVIPKERRHRTCKTRASLSAYWVYNICVHTFFLLPTRILDLKKMPASARRWRKERCKALNKFSRNRLGPLMEKLFPNSEKVAVTAADIVEFLPDIARSNDLLAQYCQYDLESFGYITTSNLRQHLDGAT